VLRHENAVLRRRLNGPVRYEAADRFWLAALSSLLPRHRWRSVFPVTPGTLLAWTRRLIARKWDYTARRRRTGRPIYGGRADEDDAALGAGEPTLGHRRIQGGVYPMIGSDALSVAPPPKVRQSPMIGVSGVVDQ
jgi:hypothetical protein